MSRLGVFGNIQTKIAHASTIPALGNKDLRLLQEWISTEKSVVSSVLRLINDLDKANEALTHWGAGEGDDLGDILSRSRDLLSHASIAFSRFAEHEGAMRAMLKGMRTREEELDEAKKRRRSLVGKAEAAQRKLSKMGQENKQLQSQTELLMSIRQEIAQLDGHIYHEEAAITDFKRRTTKDIMVLKFGGLAELAEKITIVGTLGKDLIEDIPLDATVPGQMRRPYTAFDKTRMTAEEAARCVNSVVFMPNPAETLPPQQGDHWSPQSQQFGVPNQQLGVPNQQLGPPNQVPLSALYPQISEPESVAQAKRPELPHHLPSNIGLPSPVDLSTSTGDWLSAGPTSPVASPTVPSQAGSNPYAEFGQISSPVGGRAAATFPIAAAHSRDAALSTGPGTVSGRPSSLAYMQDTPNTSAVPEPRPLQVATQTPAPSKDGQPPSITANPWENEASPVKGGRKSAETPATSPQSESRRAHGRNPDDYHYEYNDNAFWVRNNVPATRALPSEEVTTPSSLTNTAEVHSPTTDDSPLEPPQPHAIFGSRSRSSSQVQLDRPADHDESARLGVGSRPRLDASPTPSQRSTSGLANSPEGVRTIAAAAFRRGPRPSTDSINDTAPLHVNKKAAPSGMALTDPSTPPFDEPPTLAQHPGQAVADSNTIPAIASQTPVVQGSESESGASYAGVHGRRLPAPPSPGYAQGQFSTSLE